MMRRLFGFSVSAVLLVGSALGPVDSIAGQIPFTDYKWLRPGMDKGEVMVRAGQPDSISVTGEIVISDSTLRLDTDDSGRPVVGGRRVERTVTLETWRYIPATSEPDPFLTVIMFRGDEVWDIHREKVFSRSTAPAPVAAPTAAPVGPPAQPVARESPAKAPPRSQADVVLQAAEEYARIRARLKKQLRESRESATE